MAIPDRRPREVGKGRGEASLTGRAARPVENGSRAEAYGAPADIQTGALGGCNALVHLPYPASGWRVTTIPMRVLVTICNLK